MRSVLFVDDETRVLQGIQRQLRAMRHEWDMKFADSGARALEMLASAPVEVVVTDMKMPGMDGAQLLTAVRERYPDTMRLVLSGHSEQESIFRLVGPAHQYLSKPCDTEELRIAIARALAMRDLISDQPLKRLVTGMASLPVLPSVYSELTSELHSATPSPERIAEIISKDPAMAAKVLQLVNSAFFGLAQPASNLKEAVVYLGMATVRALVLSLQLFSQFDEERVRQFSIESLATHSWKTGVLARKIAQVEKCGAVIEDQCFLAGLLHDIGHLILAAGLPEQYDRMLHAAQSSGRVNSDAEQAEFGATHAAVGAYLLGLWGLPAPVVEAVSFHHSPDIGQAQKFSPLIAVHVADAIVKETWLPPLTPPAQALNEPLLASLQLEQRIEAWRKLASEETEIQ